MKYPQLVSTRAVNAISDWLVSRLEQLGVEAPLIYSRLLLSLLQTSVQINDPIEFSNLENFLANRKGSKRISPSDTETLKKVTAVQCLMDAVSSEQEISNAENLIDELCDKLCDIEKQNNEDSSEDTRPPKFKSFEAEDPRKRYYRAFPALSKEMEDSVWISKRNAKALTWPTVNTTSCSGINALCNTAGVRRKPKRRRNQSMSKVKSTNIRINSYSGSGNNGGGAGGCSRGVRGSCSPTWDTDFEGSWEMGQDLIGEFLMMQNSRNRSTSESDAFSITNIENLEKRMKPTEGEDDDNNENAEQYFSLPAMTELKVESIKTYNDDEFFTSDNDLSVAYTVTLNDEGYSTPEALNSVSEMETMTSSAARRLYERDISNDSISATATEQSDFAAFEAKFNSSVEALWKDNATAIESSNSILPHKNVENFWTNYYNHHYDAVQLSKNTFADNKPSDYFSMPIHFGQTDSESSNIKTRQLSNESFTSGVTATCFNASIWSSDNQQNSDESNSFYANMLTSSYENDKKDEHFSESILHENYPYGNSKWSECSFETPFIPPSSSTISSTNDVSNKKDLRENMLKNSYMYNNKQQLTPQLKSSAPQSPVQNTAASMSLPDFYGSVSESAISIYKEEENFCTIVNKKSTITLANHSENSGFVEVALLKSKTQLEPKLEADYSQDNINSRPTVMTPIDDDENLLTSDRTHFRPIKQTYPDGYEFDISDSLDEVNFERSESGFLCLDSDKYLEYKESNIAGDGNSSALNTGVSRSEIFSIKFRIKQTEKCCQTDDTTITDEYILDTKTRIINNDGAEKEDINENHLEGESVNLPDEEALNLTTDHWSLDEIRKKCNDNSSNHTLWGMCSTCNRGNKSLPANRLLKDELSMEGDKIMSDLKFMQDLYIGSDWEDDDEDTEMEKESDLYEAVESNYDYEQEQVFYNVKKLISDLLKPENAKSLAEALGTGTNPMNNIVNEWHLVDDCQTVNNLNVKNWVQSKEAALICNNNMNNNDQKYINNNYSNNNNNINGNNWKKSCQNNKSDGEYVGCLWNNNGNSIWQKDSKSPNVSVWSKFNANKDNIISEQLNWEYSNLAEIWNSTNTTVNDKETTRSSHTNANFKHIDMKLPPGGLSNNNNSISLNTNISQKQQQEQEHQYSYQENFIHQQQKAQHQKLQDQWQPQNNTVDDKKDEPKPSLISSSRYNVVNRSDRKRRHSASQNINLTTAHTSSLASALKVANALADNIVFGNKIGIIGEHKMEYGRMCSIDNDAPATIITCKYWATLDTSMTGSTSPPAPYFFMDKNTHFDGISGAITINPSLLKHVAVDSRPLTR